ncbi:hypothetical protein BDP81DRAFT_129410 [Colletotrichum phormii]|uniref:Uncharacterized protein n=1 Tax=Colletotrichum phormii TaxID=359342 RepID=A0AAJ0A0J0_9PEZI|nr:uncharacterized protein BDP81DRAFT_129410 [Colletotrichum phormii]KAK1641205.1 hypothetical protein BDP81DRAFT_129410 [Colletotrichum phormii]
MCLRMQLLPFSILGHLLLSIKRMLNVGILLCKEKAAVIPVSIYQSDGFRSKRYCTTCLAGVVKICSAPHPFHLAFLAPPLSSPSRTNYDLAGDWPSLQSMPLHPYESYRSTIVDRSLDHLLASLPWVSARQ